MLTSSSWIQRTRKRHLAQVVIISFLVICQLSLQLYYYSQTKNARTVLADIAVLEDLVIDLSNETTSSNLRLELRQEFSRLSVDIRLLEEKILTETRQYFANIEAEISVLTAEEKALTQSGLRNITTEMKVVEKYVIAYQSDLSQMLMAYSGLIFALLALSLTIGGFLLNRTFNTINVRYRSIVARVMANAKKATRDSKDAFSSKQRLLKNMRHELRTPVATVIGCLELLAGSSNDSGNKLLLSKSRAASFHLLHELDALAQEADIDNPFSKLNLKPYNLLSVVEQAAAEFSMNCQRQGIDFEINHLVPKNTLVVLDAQRFVTMLLGLLFFVKSNSSMAKITCTLNLEYRSDNESNLQVIIDSNRIKASQSEIDNIWENGAFNEQLVNDRNRYARIPLVKHYCKLMRANHQLKVKNNTLAVTLAIPVLVSELCANQESQQLKKTYAIVDDLSTSRDYISYLIEQAGGQTQQFKSGSALLSALKEGNHYSAIILDIHMPDVSGIETVDMLKAIYQNDNLPIIMVSADAELLNQTMAENKGIEQVFSKPIDAARLLDTLSMIELHGTLSLASKSINILLVEDDTISAEFVSYMLLSFGYTVKSVGTGKEAIQTLSSERFDVALIDINLPDMSGYDIAEYASEKISVKERPVMLALTSNTLETDREKSLSAGMKYHICKPVSLAELKKSIELALKLKAKY